MKRMIPMLALAIMLGSASLFAEEDETSVPQNLTFQQIRNAALSPERAESIKSGRVICTVTGKKIPKALIMVRAKMFDKVRVDVIKDGEFFCAVRNGESFWTYDAKNGAMAMSPEDAADFEKFIVFLGIPFYSKENSVFAAPVFKKEEKLGKAMCSCFDVKPQKDDESLYQMWIENKARVLHKVEFEDAEGNRVSNTYRNYKKFNGVQMPGSIYVTNSKGTAVLKLGTADWNIDVNDSVFVKTEKPEDHDVALLRKSALSEEVQIAQKKEAKDKARAEKLEKRILKLKLEIADIEKKMDFMVNAVAENRETAAGLASVTSTDSRRRSYWNGWGWTSSGGNRAANVDARNRRKMLKEGANQTKKLVRNYQEYDDELLKKQKELAELEYELEKLKISGKEE